MTELQVDEFFEHHGVKGMRWGIRKSEESSGKSTKTPEETAAQRKQRAKQIAIGVGALTAAAGTAYVGYQLHKNGKLPFKSIKASTSAAAKSKVENIIKEPTDIIHAGRSKHAGFRFLKSGGLSDALHEYEKAGFERERGDFFVRYGDRAEKIAVRFTDPAGRRDAATRPLFHELIIPESMSKDVHGLDDVKTKIWPLVKDSYESFYASTSDPDWKTKS